MQFERTEMCHISLIKLGKHLKWFKDRLSFGKHKLSEF